MMEMLRDLSFSHGRWGGVEGWLGEPQQAQRSVQQVLASDSRWA